MDFVNANVILGVCVITQEETPLCHDFRTFVKRAFLSRSLYTVLQIEEERLHSTIMRFTKKNYENSCKGCTIKPKFANGSTPGAPNKNIVQNIVKRILALESLVIRKL